MILRLEMILLIAAYKIKNMIFLFKKFKTHEK